MQFSRPSTDHQVGTLFWAPSCNICPWCLQLLSHDVSNYSGDYCEALRMAKGYGKLTIQADLTGLLSFNILIFTVFINMPQLEHRGKFISADRTCDSTALLISVNYLPMHSSGSPTN